MKVIAPIILILASVGIFIVYTNPLYTDDTGSMDPAGKSIKELQSEEKDYLDALSKTREIELVRDGLLVKFNALDEGDKERILKLLPDHIDSVRLIIDINNIAARYGMSLSSIILSAPGVPSVPAAKKSSAQGNLSQESSGNDAGAVSGIGPDSRLYDSVKLGFNVFGPYENFLLFLTELEESLRVVDIISLSFGNNKESALVPETKSQTGNSKSFTYSMTIRTYYLK